MQPPDVALVTVEIILLTLWDWLWKWAHHKCCHTLNKPHSDISCLIKLMLLFHSVLHNERSCKSHRQYMMWCIILLPHNLNHIYLLSRCFGMLLSPGQKVRNSDMHLLDMVRHVFGVPPPPQYSHYVTACFAIAIPQAQYYMLISFISTHFSYLSVANFRNT